MKQFVIRIGIYFTATILLMVVFDRIYTVIYSKSVVRNKIQLVLNAPPKHYDVLIVGSSRSENHVIPQLFEAQKISAYNIGMSGGNLCENALQLKLFFEKGNTVDVILLQMDLNFDSEKPAEGIKAVSLPYLQINKMVYDHYSQSFGTENLFAEAEVPFYRYMHLDAKIGFREVLFTMLKKESNTLKTAGFAPLDGKMTRGDAFVLPAKAKAKNRYYDEIRQLCKVHEVKLIAFEAPFCSNVVNADYFSKLQKNVPELYDYSKVVQADSLFASCGHMNRQGAEVFTRFILKTHFQNQGK